MNGLHERLERIERNLARLAAEAGIEIEDAAEGVDTEVAHLARSGRRLQAAKLQADRYGVSLIEAQRLVNQL